MARNRFLPSLAAALVLLAGSAWLAHWALITDRLQARSSVVAWSSYREELTVAAVAALLLLAAFRTVIAAALRRGDQAPHSAGHLQTMTALVLAVVTFAVLAGDFSSTLISLGLVGFGLTLALQRPILALAGWATIIFGTMFREGDRIQVGDLEGDVLAITLFTTKLWEIGAPDDNTPGRPTARIRTISNAVFLEQPVANATSDTAIVFDEFIVNVAFESDQAAAEALLEEVSDAVVDADKHQSMAEAYRRLTRGLRIEANFPQQPVILAESKPSWMEYRLRYLVDARRAGIVQGELTRAWNDATAAHPEILPIYPRVQSMRIDGDGRPLDAS